MVRPASVCRVRAHACPGRAHCYRAANLGGHVSPGAARSGGVCSQDIEKAAQRGVVRRLLLGASAKMKAKELVRRVKLVVVGAAALACSAEAGEDPVATDTTTEALTDGEAYAWLWASQTTGAYDATSRYSYNSSGGTNRVVNTSTGSYRVDFPGLGARGGHVQVTAYGSNNVRCKVSSWMPSSILIRGVPVPAGDDLHAYVRCHTPTGDLANSQFVIWYQKGQWLAPYSAYVWASQPTKAEYTATDAYSWNSKGGVNIIEREGVGKYSVVMGGFDDMVNTAGNVLVTAYGSGSEHCKVKQWDREGFAIVSSVACFDTSGAAVDTMFALSFAWHLPSDGVGLGGYVLADNETAAEYEPAEFYSENIPPLYPPSPWSVDPQAGRYDKGVYYVHYPFMPGYDTATALVTAHGSSSNYCKVQSWGDHAGDADLGRGTRVNVRCFDAAGNLKDTEFSQRFGYALP
jgi:hypothetical protein